MPLHISAADILPDDPKAIIQAGRGVGTGQGETGDAVVEARHGKGRVILIAFRPQFRGQPHGTFKFLFNGIYD